MISNKQVCFFNFRCDNIIMEFRTDSRGTAHYADWDNDAHPIELSFLDMKMKLSKSFPAKHAMCYDVTFTYTRDNYIPRSITVAWQSRQGYAWFQVWSSKNWKQRKLRFVSSTIYNIFLFAMLSNIFWAVEIYWKYF